MKFTPEVVAALAVLREHAENDFERHRLDVLERDLTAPPTVEIVDDTHQRFDGIIYGKDPNGHYRKNISIHQAVWMYNKGELLLGYDIHHIDTKKDNNKIENLQLLTPSEHHKIHRTHPTIEKICPVCGKSFLVPYKFRKQVCCSKNCSCIYRRRPDKEKICEICGKTFIPPHNHPNTRTCSASCGAKLACLLRGDKLFVPRICIICGKKFIPPGKTSNRARTCSPTCAGKLRWQTRKTKHKDK